MSLLLCEQKLKASHRKQVGTTESPTTDMYGDCQELLQLFGLPYIIAPAEAEAQCAWLDAQGLVDGVVTDDNDAFLFGAQHIYRYDNRPLLPPKHACAWCADCRVHLAAFALSYTSSVLRDGLVEQLVGLALATQLLKPTSVIHTVQIKATVCNPALGQHRGGCCLVMGARAHVEAVSPGQVVWAPLPRMVSA